MDVNIPLVLKTVLDITIQTCWDSDRLDLGRVGIMLHPSRLCTTAAMRAETISGLMVEQASALFQHL